MVRLCWLVINVVKQFGLSKKLKNVSIPARILAPFLKTNVLSERGNGQLKGYLAEFMKENGNQ